ncbi:uncharacterized protein LOC119636599 [Glossina fuscipes]|uniref:Uncharacterized protein LOC119636599 n=2 Tax=Nemorhina TaxID=44051 RepID=A0A9C5Z1C6_9MUSC|nr:uncharacterized protein LOC119636599 [Glossina fuscipes]KAI9583072.1 hypothetical protein GQX74_012289 [Glossina fuscipes]
MMLTPTFAHTAVGRCIWTSLNKLLIRNFARCEPFCPATPKEICEKEKPEANRRAMPAAEVQREAECHYTKKCVETKSQRACTPRKPKCPNWEIECQCAKREGQKHMTCVEMVTTKMDPNECCPVDGMINTECASSRTKSELKRENEPFRSLWNYQRECCVNNPCPNLLPRFDELYWCPSDKYTREYQQTWVECPRLKILPRKTCCYEDLGLPPVCRRPRQAKIPTACAFNPNKLNTLKKICIYDQRCPRIQMPCCMRARVPPKCTPSHPKSNCKKYCCPYPSLAECCRQCPIPSKPIECTCKPAWTPTCDVYSFLRRKQVYNLPPPLPAWPPK